ncbi:unnamed protein product, partial [Rotaria magnacalcarata]
NQTNNLFLEIRKHHWCCKLLSDPTTGDNSLKTTMSTFAKVRTRVIFLIGIFTGKINNLNIVMKQEIKSELSN